MITIPKTHEAWLHERKYGLGASDAGSIIGVNPWKTNVQLWAEKTGQREPEDISQKPAVKYGHDAEQHIRALFALDNPEYQVEYISPYKMIFHDEWSWLFCTPDGELTEKSTGRKGILEIKTTEIMNSNQWKEWDGRVPNSYYAQILHQLIATGWDFAILKARIKYRKDGVIRIAERQYTIEAEDVRDDMQYLLDKEKEFWQCVGDKKEPPIILPNI